MSEIDAALVQRVLAGDRAAFEALVSAHLTRARAVARAVLGNDPAVDDVVQEAFLHAYDRLGQLGDPAIFPSWLHTIVRNEAVTWLRRHARRRTVNLDQADLTGGVELPPEDAKLERLRAALAKLPAPYREILALKYEAGLNYEQIADSLDLSVANVEKRLYRARQALLQLLPDLGEGGG
jgi:RNA polymerase sigma-70 factor (ECF subfamily)